MFPFAEEMTTRPDVAWAPNEGRTEPLRDRCRQRRSADDELPPADFRWHGRRFDGIPSSPALGSELGDVQTSRVRFSAWGHRDFGVANHEPNGMPRRNIGKQGTQGFQLLGRIRLNAVVSVHKLDAY